MKKLNIKKFASGGGDVFEVYTHYTENYDQQGNCISVTVLVNSSINIASVDKNGKDVSSAWGNNFPTTPIQRTYTENTTETLTFISRYGEEWVETITIDQIQTVYYEYASNANMKINSDIKINNLTLGEIDTKINSLFNLIYPIGSVYKTKNASFNPNNSFSGTWVKSNIDQLVAYAHVTSTTTLSNSYNISSYSGSSGAYTVNFSKPMANANYNVVISAEASGAGAEITGVYNYSTSGFNIDYRNYNGEATNPTIVSILVFGKLSTPEYYIWERTA